MTVIFLRVWARTHYWSSR